MTPKTGLILKNRAKIIATLGPASDSDAMVTQMMEAGANVFRLNMSHGDHSAHRARAERVRAVAKKLNRPASILVDLQGPKLRTGLLVKNEPVALTEGETVYFKASDEAGDGTFITCNSPELLGALEVGNIILLNDGALQLRVEERLHSHEVRTIVLVGGELNERKGVNVPTIAMGFSALTEKDRKDARFALDIGADYLALSFVRSADDVGQLKDFLAECGAMTPPLIIAKIEKPQAVENIDGILEEAFGIMVARGDLGVEISIERVPIVQKQLIQKANAKEKPVIVATQMLESMIESAIPSRAEISDIANAVFDGADALMLSGETAVGQNPDKVITTMRQAIEAAETYYQTIDTRPHEPSSRHTPSFHHTIAHAASYASIKSEVKALVVLSSSGRMAGRISKLKPHRPIIALTEDRDVYNRMSLLWGVQPIVLPFQETTEEILNVAEEEILRQKLLAIGDSVLFCAGNTPILGASNMIKFFRIGEAVRSSIGLL